MKMPKNVIYKNYRKYKIHKTKTILLQSKSVIPLLDSGIHKTNPLKDFIAKSPSQYLNIK